MSVRSNSLLGYGLLAKMKTPADPSGSNLTLGALV
jgi:hypothetical protein